MAIQFNGGSSPVGQKKPTLPQYNTGNLATQDQQNIGGLLSGQFDPFEYNMRSAEGALGTGGGGFAQAGRLKLLDSEKLARMKLGHEELDPYLQREHQTALQTQAEKAHAADIAQEGALALQRLQLSESGQGARLSEELKARLEQQVLEGNQAMSRLQLSESGQTERTKLGIGGNIVNTVLSEAYRNNGLPNYNQKYGGKSYNYQTDTNGVVTGGSPPPADYWNPTGIGGGSGISAGVVQNILRKYGLS